MEQTFKKRPSERAAEYLTEYLNHRALHEDLRLPSTRFIAQKLNISEGTVRNVLHRLRKEGTLHPGGKDSFPRIRIGTNVGVLEHSRLQGYPGKILLSAANTVMRLGTAASISSIFSYDEYDHPPSARETARRCDGLDAILISQSAIHTKTLIAHCSRQKKPYVVVNAPAEDTTTNFVSPNQTKAFFRLGQALIQAGRTRLALLIFPAIAHSVAIRQRVAGLVNAVGTALEDPIHLRIVPCQSWLRENGREATETLLQSGYLPDAILTAGDHLAVGALDALQHHGLRVPDDVSLITGGGVESTVGNFTRLSLPVMELGKQAVEMLVLMVRNRTPSIPGRYIDIPILSGCTTTPEENRLLHSCDEEEAKAALSNAFS